MDTIHSTTNVAGQTIKVGSHFATLSGKAELSMDDRLIVWNLSLNKPDYEITQFDCEIVCGPIWNDVNQCSFVISTAEFDNTNADEDDKQGWQVVPKS